MNRWFYIMMWFSVVSMSIAEETQSFHVPTADGARLFMKRYPRAGPPVLCVHGLAANLRSFDLPLIAGNGFEYYGLAAHLRRRGFDMWLLNLRGAGVGPEESSLPAGKSTWTIDNHAIEDLPAAIDWVREETGQQPLIVGHSLGALSTLIYLEGARWGISGGKETQVILDEEEARQRARRVRGAVLIAPPARLVWSDGRRPAWLALTSPADFLLKKEKFPERLRLSRLTFRDQNRFFNGRFGAALKNFAYSIESLPLEGVLDFAFGTARNRPAIVFAKVRQGVLSDCSRDVLLQFAESISAGKMLSFTASNEQPAVDYSAHYGGLRTPFQVVLGRRDRIVDAEMVRRYLIDELQQAECEEVLLDDYGHADLLLGALAPRDVYPAIERWLISRAYD